MISRFDYGYDKTGNRTGVLEADGSRVTWSYDATYQLTGDHRTGTTPYRDTYTYDAAGNRLLKIHDGARTSYSYDAANQLKWTNDGTGRTTYTFDADGNQQAVREPSGNRTTYSWDYENKMILSRLPDATRSTMSYEPDGLRVKLEEPSETKKFVWDDQNYLSENRRGQRHAGRVHQRAGALREPGEPAAGKHDQLVPLRRHRLDQGAHQRIRRRHRYQALRCLGSAVERQRFHSISLRIRWRRWIFPCSRNGSVLRTRALL